VGIGPSEYEDMVRLRRDRRPPRHLVDPARAVAETEEPHDDPDATAKLTVRLDPDGTIARITLARPPADKQTRPDVDGPVDRGQPAG
jgi:hypothetical protein